MSDAANPKSEPHGSIFPATRWSMVFKARNADDSIGAAALGDLCRIYWPPVYAFLRRQGNSPPDAEDLTQGFFVMLLDRRSLATVDEAKGRLRSFILVALKRFAANEYERGQAKKRGGGAVHLSIDAGDAEERFPFEPSSNLSPDLLFEKQWALTLLDTVLKKVREAYARDGRETVFDELKDRISADGDAASLASVAAQLGMNEGAVKVAVHRMRQRYRKMLRDEIALTVETAEEVAEEIAHLFQVFAKTG